MKETLKKLAGKALPWVFWTTIVCSGLVVLMSILIWIGTYNQLAYYKTEGFYAEYMAKDFVREGDGYASPIITVGFLAGLVALGCGFFSRQFKRPIVALSVVVGSFILLLVAESVPFLSASGYDNDLCAKPGYTEAKEVEKQLCLINNVAHSDWMIHKMSESMYRQIENSVSEVRNYNRETVKMICAGADSSTIESRNHNARQQAILLSQAVLNNHGGTSGNGGYDGGYNGGY